MSRRSRWQTEMAEVMDARWRHHGGEAVEQFERRQDLRASALVGIVLMYGGVWRIVLGRALREASPPSARLDSDGCVFTIDLYIMRGPVISEFG